MIPNGWKWRTIGEIAQVTSGGTPNRNNSSYWGGTIPWITTGDINFNVITSAREFISEEGTQNSSAKPFPKSTLLMAMYGQGMTRGKAQKRGLMQKLLTGEWRATSLIIGQ